MMIETNLFNTEFLFHLFFHKEFRRKKSDETIVISDYINRVFNDIYINHADKCTLKINNVDQHPFFGLILNRYKVSRLSCDEIFLRYLEYVSDMTNKEYFLFVFKFIILFRECLNKYKNIELENTLLLFDDKISKDIREFTQYYDSELVPEICNEFITEYLISNEYFGMSREYFNEFIEIVQHLCFWLYENNYTSSKLSLITNI